MCVMCNWRVMEREKSMVWFPCLVRYIKEYVKSIFTKNIIY